jgi:hypothetical protein
MINHPDRKDELICIIINDPTGNKLFVSVTPDERRITIDTICRYDNTNHTVFDKAENIIGTIKPDGSIVSSQGKTLLVNLQSIDKLLAVFFSVDYYTLVRNVAQAIGGLPQGRWTPEKVTIEKNTAGNIQTATYNTVEDVMSYIPCPKEWKISAKTIVLRYLDDVKKTFEYTLKDNLVTITTEGMVQSYQYSINGEKLIMNITYNYVSNLPAGETEQIEEKWTIDLLLIQ